MEPTNVSPLFKTATRIEDAGQLDRIIRAVDERLPAVLHRPEARRLLGGAWLGHAVHPLLTDLPLGAWTSATLLDIFGTKRSARAATGLIGFGIVAAIPTAVTGLSDWSVTDQRSRRVGVVHAAANSVALLFYTRSFFNRLRGRRARGVVQALMGGAAATVGGYLGGHLTLARGTGIEATEDAMAAREPEPLPV